ncbi:class A beta-lactamase-related serine hydrolase [Cryobacterium algoritolerans]|uniref:Class A beta-lactamase-related serine hydrolase n=1 Tax=Cryobacterium algoritolerans TaxID=1259184 RepID=A0A4V3IDX5_9MICO|nr:serine hydrolase domain-containing protein [Cryobacterium algoritolerans]TFC09459.1 class A beta-lactamase-related serine hydrolase [Cryobacterium algoritolerans]
MTNVGRAPRRYAVAALAVSAALLFTGCTDTAGAVGNSHPQVRAPFPTEVAGRLDAALAEAITQSGSSGALAGVWAPWAGQWVVSPGTTAPGNGVPMGTAMSYRIGTNTTTLTCTVLAKLVDEGTVKLDDQVSTYLDRIVGLEGVTLGQLCRNTSGLADYTRNLLPQFVKNPTRIWPEREVVSSGMGSPRVALPGGAWAQSDTGVVLLGMALEAAAHQDLSSLYRSRVLEPLGMTGTSLPDSNELGLPGAHPQGFAATLDAAARPLCDTVLNVTELSPSMGAAAAGAVSTLADQKKWVSALAEGSLLTDATATAQWATVAEGADAPAWRRYGLGAEQVGPLRGRAGAIPGFISAAYSDPVSGLTIVVAFNNSTDGAGFAEAVARRLAAIVWAVPEPATTAGTDVVDSPPAAAPSTPLPWTEEEAAEATRAGTTCAPPAAPAPAG